MTESNIWPQLLNASKTNNYADINKFFESIAKLQPYLTYKENGTFNKEELIFSSKNGDFLGGDSQLTLINRLDGSGQCQTVATSVTMESTNITTSDRITQLIGQRNYNTVLTALCSVINQELRVKAILAMLTNKMQKKDASTQTEIEKTEIRFAQTKKCNPRNNRKRKLEPYVVLDDVEVNKNENNLSTTLSINEEINKFSRNEEVVKQQVNTNVNTILNDYKKNTEPSSSLPDDLTHQNIDTSTFNDADFDFNEDSNMSLGNISISNLSTISNFTIKSAILDKLDSNIDQCTYNRDGVYLTLPDKSLVWLPIKPEDNLHIATAEILNQVASADRKKIILYQLCLDYMTCLQRDEDNCLPIHNAVINQDMAVLRRHCAVLKNKEGTVDFEIDGELTPLHLALQSGHVPSSRILLSFGACVVRPDKCRRAAAHHAASSEDGCARAIVDHCKLNARSILSDFPEMCPANISHFTDQEAAAYLGQELGSMYDNQGYTPLMIAARNGWSSSVAAFLQLSPSLPYTSSIYLARSVVNLRSRGGGETALWLATAGACMQADNKGPDAPISRDYIETIQLLLSHGADPKIENNTGTSPLSIIDKDYNYPELTFVIANGCNINNEILPKVKSLANYILVKDDAGNVQLEEIDGKQKNKTNTDSSKIQAKVIKNTTLKHKMNLASDIRNEATINNNDCNDSTDAKKPKTIDNITSTDNSKKYSNCGQLNKIVTTINDKNISDNITRAQILSKSKPVTHNETNEDKIQPNCNKNLSNRVLETEKGYNQTRVDTNAPSNDVNIHSTDKIIKKPFDMTTQTADSKTTDAKHSTNNSQPICKTSRAKVKIISNEDITNLNKSTDLAKLLKSHGIFKPPMPVQQNLVLKKRLLQQTRKCEKNLLMKKINVNELPQNMKIVTFKASTSQDKRSPFKVVSTPMKFELTAKKSN